jgi:hypothetical protein
LTYVVRCGKVIEREIPKMESIYYDKTADMFTLECPKGPSVKYEPVNDLADDTIRDVWYVGMMMVGTFEWKAGEYKAKRAEFLKKCPDVYHAREIRRQVSGRRYTGMRSRLGETGQRRFDATLGE